MSGTVEFPLLRPRRINESAQILVARLSGGGDWNAARVTPFGVPEYFMASGQDMNDDGWFVGVAPFEEVVQINKKKTETTIEWRASRHDGTEPFDLGAGSGSYAFGVNNEADVVGYLFGHKAFVYLEGLQEVVNLNEAVVGDAADVGFWTDPDTSQIARYINDSGIIAGDGSNWETGWYGFVLTPVP
jgi:hypothetical protein